MNTARNPKVTEQNNDQNEKLVFATLFVHQAAEFKALNHQAYNIGKLRLDEILTAGYSQIAYFQWPS